MRGFNRRITALEQASEPVTIYTLGPSSGDYDIEWEGDAFAGEGPTALIVKQGVVYLSGTIDFADAVGSLAIPLPEALWPRSGGEWIVSAYDDSSGEYTTTRVIIHPPGPEDCNIVLTSMGPDNDSFAVDDSVYLSGCYLLPIE